MAHSQPSLSIVVAGYNEEQNVPLFLKRFGEVHANHPFELLVVNDGSTDGTEAAIKKALATGRYPFARMVSYAKNKGYGGAIMTGLSRATGEVLAWTHADLQTDPADVMCAYRAYVAQGERKVIVKGRRTNRELGPTLFTFVMSLIASAVFGRALFDINAQPKLFGRSFYEQLSDSPIDFSLDLYLLVMAKQLGYRIVTVPVTFAARLHGESKWAATWASRVKTIKRSLCYILALRRALRS